MAKTYRWGIIGTGNIAAKFATCLAICENARLHAVASRCLESADTFGNRFKVPVRHASYEALARDPEVDVVYVATPHVYHGEIAIQCLRAGKAVLCEKPFTLNLDEAEEVFSVARETGQFVMEGMWTRFFPAIQQVQKWIVAGAIGEPRMVQASFGFRMDYGDRERLWDPALGGGSLLDVGIYPITIASIAFQDAPASVCGAAHLSDRGVDEQAAFVLKFLGGRLAVLSSAIRTVTNWDAYIYGEHGMIQIHRPFWQPEKVSLIPGGDSPEAVEVFEHPHESLGFEYEIREVMRCLDAGLTECPAMPQRRTLEIMGTMDKLRALWEMRYPGE
jgi:dihydrodiol dehydrogenase / D-xylose 1-dehydrogenase (NADP)